MNTINTSALDASIDRHPAGKALPSMTPIWESMREQWQACQAVQRETVDEPR